MTSSHRDGKSYREHDHRNNRRRRSGQLRGYHQDRGQYVVSAVTPVTHKCLTTMVVSHPRLPLLLQLILLECALGLPTTQEETRTRASQLPSAPADDSSTAMRHIRPVRRQHCRTNLRLFRKVLVYQLPACPITLHIMPLLRAHGRLRRLLQIITVQCR